MKLQKRHINIRDKTIMDTIKKLRLDYVLNKAEIEGHTFKIRNDKYEEALGISRKGYTVWLMRDVDEININNYNKEWIKAWNGNMDLKPCFDYFAIITYITDYYMKDESGTVEVMKTALENCHDESLKKKMMLVKNAFLTSRQAGESEVYYKLLPQLHLSESNIGTLFLETGFKKNRSRFLKQIQKEEINANNKDVIIEVDGKEDQFYIEKSSMMDKWFSRDVSENNSLRKLCYSQFVKRYDPIRKIPKNAKFAQKEWKKEDGDHKDDMIYELDSETNYRLPDYIRLKDPLFPNELKWMKQRKPRVIRFHIFKRTKDPNQFYYSEMQLYLPHQNEEELFPDDFEKCLKKYLENEEKIQYVKKKVMPHFEQVVELREKAEEFLSNIGDELDANKEQQEEECAAEGVREHPDLAVLDPTGTLNEEPTISAGDKTFRKIELETNDRLFEKIRSLDPDQKKVFDIGLAYAKDFIKASKKKENKWPDPPLLAVIGGAGSGKSHLIDVLSQMIDKTLRTPGDDPGSPYVLKMAFTGNAAAIIKGQTLHSAFNFKFNNQLTGLGDKLRDLRRKQLHNLRFLIIDEISLVKSDLLYQLDFRLKKDIFQNSLTYSGLACIILGDLMQIRPPGARHVFLSPQNPRLQILHKLDPLWEKFKVILLKTNHRQGEDKKYADILNRIRVGEQTKEDIRALNTRVFPRDSSLIPKDALVITGENKIVNRFNNEKLNELPGELFEFNAQVFSNTRGAFVPKLDNAGQVKGTPLQYLLKLKVGCRVMLTWNIDVCDNLSNGSLGKVIGFKRDSNNKIK